MYLIGIAPPGNIAKKICRIQDIIFQKTGLISSFAFPVLIPIVFRASCPETAFLRNERKTEETSVRTKEWSVTENSLYLSTTNELTWRRIKKNMGIKKGPRLFATSPGLFLGFRETKGVNLELLKNELPPPPELRWKTSHLLCLKLEIESSGPWWENIFCEAVFEEKMRAPSE